MALDKEAIKQRHEELQKGEGDFQYLKLKESGSPHRIRVLPAWNQSGIPWKEAYFHYNVGERTYACPKANINQPCPICELVEEAAKSKKKGDRKFAQEMAAKFRAFFNVVDMKHQDDGIQIWPVGKMILKQVLSIMGDPDFDDITSVKKGHTLTVEVEGSGRSTRYTVWPRPKASKIPDSVPVDEVFNLDKLVNIHTYDWLQRAMEGEEDLEDEDFNAGDPNYVPDDEWGGEEAPEEEAEEETAEEEEKPKRTPKKKASKKESVKRTPKRKPKKEEEEEEEPEEEAEEEEAAEEEPAEEEAGEEETAEEEEAEEDSTEKEIHSILDRLKKKKAKKK